MSDKLTVLVTGGTGTLGRQVVTRLRAEGHRARILSRNPRGHVDAIEGDLATGAGMAKAVAGVDVIVHAASATREPARIRAVDVDGTRRLFDAARGANVQHVVYISIVGIDRVPTYPYYRAKLQTEAVVREGVVPWSILRATQFHGFVEVMLRRFCLVPGFSFVPCAFKLQPVDVAEVAVRVVDVALQPPAGMLPDFGGPEVTDMRTLAIAWLAARKSRRKLVNLPLPFRFGRDMAAGGLLSPDHRDGTITFQRHLSEIYG